MTKNSAIDAGNFEYHRLLAERHCNRGSQDCRWYHGSWELLKSLGVVSTSAVHAGELHQLLNVAGIDRLPAPRILISGSTDATLLQILACARTDGARHAHITAIDRCATPLALMEQYAHANGFTFSAVREDILNYCPGEHYDLILTHAFMGYFDAGGRAQLLHKWASLLTDGGCVVTVQRIRPPDSPLLVRFSAEQSTRFVEAALAAAQSWGLPLAEQGRVRAAAGLFTENFLSHALTSTAQLEQLFLNAGLTFRHLEYQALTQTAGLSGPSVPSGGEYGFIVAERKLAQAES